MSLESPSSSFWLLPITLTNSDPHTHTLLSLCVRVLSSVCALVIRYATGAAGAAIHQGMESGIAKTFDHRAGRQGQLWFAGQAEKGEQNRTGTGKSFVPVLTSPAASVVFHTLIEWLSRHFTPLHLRPIHAPFHRRYAKDSSRRPKRLELGYLPAAPTPVSCCGSSPAFLQFSPLAAVVVVVVSFKFYDRTLRFLWQAIKALRKKRNASFKVK